MPWTDSCSAASNVHRFSFPTQVGGVAGSGHAQQLARDRVASVNRPLIVLLDQQYLEFDAKTTGHKALCQRPDSTGS